jgi:two-component system KDP operon response regulator KdpE
MQEPLAYDDGYLAISLDLRQVFVRGVPVHLTATEYGILAELFQNASRVVAHQQILERVWGKAYTDAVDYVHVYVSRLRRKLEVDPGNPTYLRTVRGVGYRFGINDLLGSESGDLDQ